MQYTKILFGALLLGLFFFLETKAQIQVGFNGMMGIPMEDFREKSDLVGGGVSGYVFAPVGESPVHFGADLGYLIYGTESYNEIVNISGFMQEYEVRTTNNILLGHLALRLKPRNWKLFCPYLDGLVGFKHLYTRTTLTDEFTEEQLDSSTDFADWAFSYGGGGGIIIGLSDVLRIDLRVLYLYGGKAEYLEKGGITTDNFDNLIFNTKRSETTLLMPQVGVVLVLE